MKKLIVNIVFIITSTITLGREFANLLFGVLGRNPNFPESPFQFWFLNAIPSSISFFISLGFIIIAIYNIANRQSLNISKNVLIGICSLLLILSIYASLWNIDDFYTHYYSYPFRFRSSEGFGVLINDFLIIVLCLFACFFSARRFVLTLKARNNQS
jgi:hypothetical protein